MWRFAIRISLALLSCYMLFTQIQSVPPHVDEIVHVNNSLWFDQWLTMDFERLRRVEPLKLSDAPVAAYLIGLVRWLSGYSGLVPEYRWPNLESSPEGQSFWVDGRMLFLSRFPMTALALMTILVIMRAVGSAFGELAGALAVAAIIGTHYFRAQLVRSMTEAPLVFSLSLASLIWAQSKAYHPLMRAAVSGLVLGIAAASKHNGAVGIAGVALLEIVGFAKKDWSDIASRVALTTATAFSMFVFLTPVLHENTFSRLQLMLQRREALFELHRVASAHTRLDTLEQRVARVSQRVLNEYLPISCLNMSITKPLIVFNPETQRYEMRTEGTRQSILVHTPLCMSLQQTPHLSITPVYLLNLSFVTLGILRVVVRGRRALRTRGIGLIEAFCVVWLVVSLVSILLIPFDWANYYIAPALLAAVLLSVGIWTVLSPLAGFVIRRFALSRRSATQTT